MISATDPVAVVALLEELNAPLYLKVGVGQGGGLVGEGGLVQVLIDGEALLNDGAAIVLFHGLEAIIFQHQSYLIFPELLGYTIISALIGYITARSPSLPPHLGWTGLDWTGLH